jgi:hypothetical protein
VKWGGVVAGVLKVLYSSGVNYKGYWQSSCHQADGLLDSSLFSIDREFILWYVAGM